MEMIPTQDNVIIQLPEEKAEETTKSGIILAGISKQQDFPEQGIVVAVGDGRILNNGVTLKPTVKVGDKVVFNKFSGTKITDEEKQYLILKENDILAIIK